MVKKINNTKDLIKAALKEETNICFLSADGALVTSTGKYTGRAANAKRIVKDELTKNSIDWDNNQAILPSTFKQKLESFMMYKNNAEIYQTNVYAVRDEMHRLPVTVYTSLARHALFTRNMFIPSKNTKNFKPEWEVYQFPGITKEAEVLISFKDKKILISGTYYSGEIKKSVFTVLNYIFPKKGFLPMHCSVNTDKNRENPAIFFGLSGTGKTTLSSDENRILIGDDEHGWTDVGLTNFEGGCYAKTIRLSKKDEPQIWKACFKEGTILENVVLDKNGNPDFNDGSLAENARASYPTSFIEGADSDGYVNLHPKNIIMLTCDAFGVLPAVAKLSPDEAVEQFLLGYTAKVAGTEVGVTEPKTTFSPCFGAPFMPLHPKEYAKILKEKVSKHNVQCWLVNTGWSGGPYGIGKRMPIKVTRNIIDSIHNGTLKECAITNHKPTGFNVPLHKDIEEKYLLPETSWQNKQSYFKTLEKLKEKISNYQNLSPIKS